MTQASGAARIRLNGQDEVVAAATVSGLLEEKSVGVAPLGIAVAVNGEVVPRAAWAHTPLRSGDRVEIVRARQGG